MLKERAQEPVVNVQVDSARLEEPIKKCQSHLLGIQNPKGYWVGELEADASVTAGYIPAMYFMGVEVDPQRRKKIVNFVLSKQRSDGTWGSYHDGPGNLSVSIQSYFSLKLAGISANEPFMVKARNFILESGGITRANVFTKIWLALFGQYDWRGVPSLPPEIIFLPNWFYFNIYEFASWSRATIMALVIVLTNKPVCQIPESADISELFVEPERQRRYSVGKIDRIFSWKTIFIVLDLLFKLRDNMRFTLSRKRALRKVEKWIVDHQEDDGSWGGIMLPWLYSLFALASMEYKLDHPVIVKGIKGLEDFIVEDESTIRLQPATSPVWDTAWSVLALRESGLEAEHPMLLNAARWLLEQEIRSDGDWTVKNRKTEPGCWAFEFNNRNYPDVDDTAVVARVLRKVNLTESEEKNKALAIDRGSKWVISLQSKDGGWAAFDRDNDKEILSHIPFADFMSPIDITSPDVSVHSLDLLAEIDPDCTAIRRGLAYLKTSQGADGSWNGRWGVNYIYGTGLTLSTLKGVGEDMEQPYIRRAMAFLESCQNQDGGWGETCRSYESTEFKGRGRSTPSQTAWALMGLMADEKIHKDSVQRGVKYLLDRQLKDGSWEEDMYTGTGFPRAFYLRYDLYRIYFPLLALAQYKRLLERGSHGDNNS